MLDRWGDDNEIERWRWLEFSGIMKLEIGDVHMTL